MSIENPGVPTDFSDYSHYILYEGCDDADDKRVVALQKGIPVYQSKSTGMLFAEDATPLIYAEDRLLDLEAFARAIIEVSGWTEELEQIANGCVMRKEAFTRVLEKASDASKHAPFDWKAM